MRNLICKGCGGSFDDNKVLCPYCGRVNDEGMAKANQIRVHDPIEDQMYEKPEQEVHSRRQVAKKEKRLKRITIGVCTVLSITMVILIGVSVYLKKYDSMRRQREMSEENFDKNFATITEAIKNKEYMHALVIAEQTSLDQYRDLKGYEDIQEELKMIQIYHDVTRDAEEYFLDGRELDEYTINKYHVQEANDLYNAMATTQQAYDVKQDLCHKMDLYLKYFYQLTDDELNELKNTKDSYEFEIEGTTEFGDILYERMQAYEKK